MTIKTTIQKINNFLSFEFLTAEPIEHPFKTKTAVKKEPEPKKEHPQHKLIYSNGLTFERIKENEYSFEDQIYKRTATRVDAITPADLEVIKAKNLKSDRYTNLKTHWASGYSAKETAKLFVGQRGYSQRTIETYFAAMGKANNTP